MLKTLFSIAAAVFLLNSAAPVLGAPPSGDSDDAIPIQKFNPLHFAGQGSPTTIANTTLLSAKIHGISLTATANDDSVCYVYSYLALIESGTQTDAKFLASVVSKAGSDASTSPTVSVMFPQPIALKYKFEPGVLEWRWIIEVSELSSGTCRFSSVLYTEDQ